MLLVPASSNYGIIRPCMTPSSALAEPDRRFGVNGCSASVCTQALISQGGVLITNYKLILVIDEITTPNAGTESQFLKLAKHLPEYGIEATVVVLKSSGCFDAAEVGHRVIRVGVTTLRNPLSWYRLLRVGIQLKHSGHRLCHIFFNDASVMVPPVFRLLGIRCLISRRDLGYWYTPGYRVALRLTRHFLSGAVVNSKAVRDVTVKEEKIPADRIDVIYNGYESEVSDSDSDEAEPLHIPKHAFLVALVANIRPIKRIDDAIQGVARARASGVDVGLVVIGDGSHYELLQLAEMLGVKDSVHFVGRRMDVKNCLEHMDAGILCSDSEGFSNAVVEYMVAGLPVICSAVGGNLEAVQNGETGYLFERGDWVSMADYLVKLANNPALCESISSNAREFAKQHFSMDVMLRSHARVYERVLGVNG